MVPIEKNEESYHVYVYGFMGIALILNVVLHVIYPLLAEESSSGSDEYTGATFVVFYFFILAFVMVAGGVILFIIGRLKLQSDLLQLLLFMVLAFGAVFLTSLLMLQLNDSTFNLLFGLLFGAGLYGLQRLVREREQG